MDDCISTTMKQFPIMLLLSSVVDLSTSPMQFIYNQVSMPLTQSVTVQSPRACRSDEILCGVTQKEFINSTDWKKRLYLKILDIFLTRLHPEENDAFGL